MADVWKRRRHYKETISTDGIKNSTNPSNTDLTDFRETISDVHATTVSVCMKNFTFKCIKS